LDNSGSWFAGPAHRGVKAPFLGEETILWFFNLLAQGGPPPPGQDKNAQQQ